MSFETRKFFGLQVRHWALIAAVIIAVFVFLRIIAWDEARMASYGPCDAAVIGVVEEVLVPQPGVSDAALPPVRGVEAVMGDGSRRPITLPIARELASGDRVSFQTWCYAMGDPLPRLRVERVEP